MPLIGALEKLIRHPDLNDRGIYHVLANVAASQTDSEVVAAVTGNKLRILAFHCQAGSTATDLTFNSASTAISPLFANAANGGAVGNFNPAGWFETSSGEALTVTTGAGSTTGITIIYSRVRV